MSKEETEKFIEAFKSDYAKFIKNCQRVAEKLSRYDNDEYGYCDIFYLDENLENVCSEGDEYWAYGGYERHNCEFPIKFLFYTDEELDAYVDGLIKKREDEHAKSKREIEEKTKEMELAELKHLKEKYENQ